MNRVTRDRIRGYLEAFDFAGLFTDPELGWDWPESKGQLRVPTKNGFLDMNVIAEKRGVKVLHVPPSSDSAISASDERKAIEKAVTPLATEHLLIFTDKSRTLQVWLWTSRLPAKPISYRELRWEKGKSNELLLQKLASISFTISEEESLDITGVVERLRDSLDRDKVTKRFYEQFKTQKDKFRSFIKGLSDGGILDWYTSLMLNRLMFCYFLQRKGFLDGDTAYLRNRLDNVRERLGKGQFHSFYKSFLRRLFHEGLGQPKDERPPEIRELIGDIPYLNGGIFEEHKIERESPNLKIPDEAFERIFTFLDDYDWHLDDRPIAKGNEINPEILGYVFEKYTNQKEMGAYYTKEDITDYIAKNCVVPFLLDAAGDKLGDNSWNLLRVDPDRYIYPAVGHGIFCDYPSGEGLKAPIPLPDYIEKGIDTAKPELRERRARWNESATPELGLPTEIWRETVARRQRCQELQRRLRAGEVRAVNDLITLNLNVRQFAQDVVENASADLLVALFKAIRKVSVLDPTCGSGAFLFAALNILEPLYRASLERMRALVGDWETRGEKHPNYRKEFTAILDQAARHPNENYFIFKSIIVHNLYGVDIMEEAVEICKLRLFLKLAAQLEPGQDIDPLPDIDFNIRAGNTLVGYASREEVRRCMTQFGDGQMRLGVEDELQSYAGFEEQVEIVDRQFHRFQDMQDDRGMDAETFRGAKRELTERLNVIRSRLDRFIASDFDKQNTSSEVAFARWRVSYRPFHWFVEFYGILTGGGFDIVIGNPPYLELAKLKGRYTVRGLSSIESGNLYGLVLEQSIKLVRNGGGIGLIIPIGFVSLDETSVLRTMITDCCGQSHLSHFAIRPAKLFTGVEQRLTILIARKERAARCQPLTTKYHQWKVAERPFLFQTLEYHAAPPAHIGNLIPKSGSNLPSSVLAKVNKCSADTVAKHLSPRGKATLFFHRTPGYWVRILDFLPFFKSPFGDRSIHHIRELQFREPRMAKVLGAVVSSSTYFHWLFASGNCRNLTRADVVGFPFGQPKSSVQERLSELFDALMKDFKKNSFVSTRGNAEYQEFDWGASKHIVDKIDEALAIHYGLDEQELDFIINYDIKIRVGLDGGSGEDE